MIHIAQPEFYENVESIVRYAKEDGYVLFYEQIDFEVATTEEMRKVKELIGFVPSPNRSIPLHAALDQEYISQDIDDFLHIVNEMDFVVDVTPAEFIAAYEEEFGEIAISNINQRTPLTKIIKSSVPASQVRKILLDYRNQHIAKAINNADYNKIIILYSSKNEPGIISELQKLNENWKRDPTRYFKEVEMKMPANPIVADGYIEKFKNQFGVRSAVHNDIEGFILNDGNQEFEIFPNTSTVGSVKLTYDTYSISLDFHPEFFGNSDDEDIRGKTTHYIIGGNFNFKRIINNLSYTKTRGYYLRNTEDFNTNWVDGDPFIQFPDLEFKGLHGTSGYLLNPRFSFNATTFQSERQLKSVGSFVPRVFYRFFSIDDKTTLTDTSSSQKTSNIELLAGIGYYHTFVKNDFYLTLGLTTSIGNHNTKLTTRTLSESFEDRRNSMMTRIDGLATVGYNGDHFYSGFGTTLNYSSYRQDNATASVGDSRFVYRIFAGIRFKSIKLPKVLNP
ncbi:MAG: DUF4421 family protein [Rivularia sp. (in: Bacteria)]|nr:DUF4421 family protein [Rivularia sp. MS3]